MDTFFVILGFFVPIASGIRLQNTKDSPPGVVTDKGANTDSQPKIDFEFSDVTSGPIRLPATLRFTLIQAIHMFHNESIPFTPFFGILLHLVREGDLIQEDDDVDVLIRAKNIPRIRSMLLARGLEIPKQHNKSHFLRTESMVAKGGAALDIYSDGGQSDYVCSMQDRMGYPRTMFEPYASRQFTLDGQIFTIDIPSQPENFLVATYGKDWHIPSPTKQGPGVPDCKVYWKAGCLKGKTKDTKLLDDGAEETEIIENLQPEHWPTILALDSHSTTTLAMASGAGLILMICLNMVGGYILKPQGPSRIGITFIVANYLVLRLLWTTLVHLTKDAPFDPKMLVLNVNLQKILISFILWFIMDGTFHDLLNVIKASPRTLFACAVPAGCFALADVLKVIALRSIDPGTYSVLLNAEFPFIAIVWQIFLRKRLLKMHWASLAAITVGIVTFSAQGNIFKSFDTISRNLTSQTLLLFTVLCITNGFALVYNESLMKHYPQVPVNLQNLSLYTFVTIFTSATSMVSGEMGITDLNAWTTIWGNPLVAIQCITLAIFGVTCSYFLKHLDNITFMAAQAGCVALAVLFNPIIFGYPISALDGLGLVFIMGGITCYSLQPVPSTDEADKVSN